jgi:hypothetical protein
MNSARLRFSGSVHKNLAIPHEVNQPLAFDWHAATTSAGRTRSSPSSSPAPPTASGASTLAGLEAPVAYGFRNPASQRRRLLRIACTRGTGGDDHSRNQKHKTTSEQPTTSSWLTSKARVT